MKAAWARLAALGAGPEASKPLARKQADWLQATLRSAQATHFGRRYGFEGLRSPQDFRAAVPLRAYEDLQPWLDQLLQGVPDVLFEGRPVAFERTGGSEGGTKVIPYSQAGLLDFQRALRPWLGEAVRRYGLSTGSCYWVTSPDLREPEELLPGVPVGLPDAAYLGEDLLPELGRLSALPPWVGRLRTEGAWRLATQYFVLTHPDLAFVSLWSPTFFLGVLDQLAAVNPELDDLLGLGGLLEGHGVPADAAALKRLQAFRAHGRAEGLWPDLRLVSAWEDGASAPFAKALRERLPQAQFEPKGLLSTEGVVSTPLTGGAPVLAGDSGFFEFLEEDGSAWFAHELTVGRTYEVVLTTASGLYRYRTGDAVICRGFARDHPRLQFLGRLGLISDLVGEKLTEAFVSACLEGLEGFRMVVPAQAPGVRYCLIVDAASPQPEAAQLAQVERRLAGNPQYAHARRMGQLGALELLPVRDPLAKFLAHQASRGHRPGDLKVPALRPEPFWEMIFREEHP